VVTAVHHDVVAGFIGRRTVFAPSSFWNAVNMASDFALMVL